MPSLRGLLANHTWQRWGSGLVSSLRGGRWDKYFLGYRCWDGKSRLVGYPEFLPFVCKGPLVVDVGIHLKWRKRIWIVPLYTCLCLASQADGLPSSGSIVRLKFRISSSFGNSIFIVLGNESSVISRHEWALLMGGWCTFLDTDLCSADSGFFLGYGMNMCFSWGIGRHTCFGLGLLHRPYLQHRDGRVVMPCLVFRWLLTL